MSDVRGRILGWGTYLPHWRLDRTTIAAVAGKGGGKGTRAVASYDEDATTMAVAAGRRALRHAPDATPTSVWLATVSPPYLDKANATAAHAALRLERTAPAYDAVGSVRSGLAALRAGMAGTGPALVLTSDLRTGPPGSADEAAGGDGAAALLVAGSDATGSRADVLGWGAVTEELLDRWRTPGEATSRAWEDRFVEARATPLGVEAFEAACKDAGVTADDVDRVLVVGLNARAAGATAKAIGRSNDDVLAFLAGHVGQTGAAQPALALAAALEQAEPGQTIGLVVLADGAEALVVRATGDVAAAPASQPTVADQLDGADLPYGRYLAWRGFLPVEPPNRPEPARPSASAAARSTDWKFGFVGSERDDGTIHLPPSAFDEHPRPMADAVGTIATFTVDRLAYSPSPPVIFAVVDFDGGGRLPVELTDVAPDDVAIGDRVELTFRRLFTADGIHNYFWKACPVQGGAGTDEQGS